MVTAEVAGPKPATPTTPQHSSDQFFGPGIVVRILGAQHSGNKPPAKGPGYVPGSFHESAGQNEPSRSSVQSPGLPEL
jgi:hypothetical protein